MKILVTGSGGQLGQAFRDLSYNFKDDEWTFLSHKELDITDRMAVYWHFNNSTRYDVCINCAAYTNVDKAESDFYNAEKLNYIGVLNLAEQCEKNNTLFVNFSTDYLFGHADSKQKPFDEKSQCCICCNYAWTKQYGEHAIKNETKANYINIRTSWLFSEYGKNFMKTIVEKIDKGEPLKVVDDQIGCPTYAADLAEATLLIVKKHFKRKKSGYLKKCHQTYNFNNGEEMSWYEFATRIGKIYGKKCLIEPISTLSTKQIAIRPKYSALSIKKYVKAIGKQPRAVNAALIECLSFFKD